MQQFMVIMYWLFMIAAYFFMTLFISAEAVRPSQATMEEWPLRVTSHLLLGIYTRISMYTQDACSSYEDIK